MTWWILQHWPSFDLFKILETSSDGFHIVSIAAFKPVAAYFSSTMRNYEFKYNFKAKQNF